MRAGAFGWILAVASSCACAQGPSQEEMLAALAKEGGFDARQVGEIKPQLESELRMRALLAKKAQAAGLDKEPAAKAAVELSRQSALGQAYLAKMEGRLAPSEAELRSDYQSAFVPKASAKAKFAVFADAKVASDALARAKAGSATIEELAAKGDDSLLAKKGGDVGWIALDALPPQVAKAMEASGEKWPAAPVRTAHGHVVYELSERAVRPEMTFEQARGDLAQRRKKMLINIELAKLKIEADRAGR